MITSSRSSRLSAAKLSGLLILVAGPSAAASDFATDIEPILREYCVACHRGSRAKNGLSLESEQGILTGGSSGAAIIPGNADGSLLYQVVARSREPFMPYEDDPLPDEQVQAIRAWIASMASSAPTVAPAAVAPVPIAVDPTAVMPRGLRQEPFWWSVRANSITAMAASRTAPVIAIGGHEQVVLYRADDGARLGVLAFPEGSVETLRFSHDGTILVAGGGRSAESGRVVLFEVATGARLLEVGQEPDVVLAADLSPDRRQIALGGPDRVLRVFDAETGSPAYELTAHTDWITAVSFSPDSVLLASGDRTGGLFVWEASTGREFHTLPPHGGRVTALGWRADTAVLASAGDDGAVRRFETESGRQLGSWNAHGGVLSMSVAPNRLLTCGRDGRATIWDDAGAAVQHVEGLSGVATSVAFTHDAARAVVGTAEGQVRLVSCADAAVVADLPANPPTVLQRAVAETDARVAAAVSAEAAARTAVETAETEARTAIDNVTKAEQALLVAEESSANAALALEQSAPAASVARVERDALNAGTVRVGAALEESRLALQTLQGEAATAAAELEASAGDAVALEIELHATTADEARTDLTARLDVARRLLDGATAVAQRAAGRVAEASVAVIRRELEQSGWQAKAAPRLAALDETLGRHAAARDAAARADADLTAARAHAGVVRSVVTATGTRADAARAAHAAAQATLEAARTELETTTTAWHAQRSAIEAANGRVDVPSATGE